MLSQRRNIDNRFYVLSVPDEDKDCHGRAILICEASQPVGNLVVIKAVNNRITQLRNEIKHEISIN